MSKISILLFFLLLFYTRFIGLDWGLPYPMHPDERNMAVALQGLQCDVSSFKLNILWFKDCFNPHFFAYGQSPLYLGYVIVTVWHLIYAKINSPITFFEATLALRIISAVASVFNVIIMIRIFALFRPKHTLTLKLHWIVVGIIILFQPYFIQFSHFGTTESLLMLLYSYITFQSLIVIMTGVITRRRLLLIGVLLGLSIGIKASSALFVFNVMFAYWYLTIYLRNNDRLVKKLIRFILLITHTSVVAIVFFVISSPHNLLFISDYLGTIRYESAVATGVVRVFYTHQFADTLPLFFQLEKIFPYVLGWPVYILAVCGFFFSSWKDPRINFLRFGTLFFFIPSAMLYAKWTRFVSPSFPFLTLFALFFIDSFYRNSTTKNMRVFLKIKSTRIARNIRFIFVMMVMGLVIVPGVAYLSIYRYSDVRFVASEWIHNNIASHSYILSETANVVDIPLPVPGDQNRTWLPEAVISFNFYDLDISIDLQRELGEHLARADYIFTPSRRIFANYTCVNSTSQSIISTTRNKCKLLSKTYPALHNYYLSLFSGTLSFVQIAEITSYPRIELFGKTILTLPDETAEETWTVFDHPVIRIYQRI